MPLKQNSAPAVPFPRMFSAEPPAPPPYWGLWGSSLTSFSCPSHLIPSPSSEGVSRPCYLNEHRASLAHNSLLFRCFTFLHEATISGICYSCLQFISLHESGSCIGQGLEAVLSAALGQPLEKRLMQGRLSVADWVPAWLGGQEETAAQEKQEGPAVSATGFSEKTKSGFFCFKKRNFVFKCLE